jgi:hypothetical protein
MTQKERAAKLHNNRIVDCEIYVSRCVSIGSTQLLAEIIWAK